MVSVIIQSQAHVHVPYASHNALFDARTQYEMREESFEQKKNNNKKATS